MLLAIPLVMKTKIGGGVTYINLENEEIQLRMSMPLNVPMVESPPELVKHISGLHQG